MEAPLAMTAQSSGRHAMSDPIEKVTSIAPHIAKVAGIPSRRGRGRGRPRRFSRPDKYAAMAAASATRPASPPVTSSEVEEADNCIEVASSAPPAEDEENYTLSQQIPSPPPNLNPPTANSAAPRTKIKLYRSSKPDVATRGPIPAAVPPALAPARRGNPIIQLVSRQQQLSNAERPPRLETASLKPTLAAAAAAAAAATASAEMPNVSDTKIPNGNLATPPNASTSPDAIGPPPTAFVADKPEPQQQPVPLPLEQKALARPKRRSITSGVRFEDDVLREHLSKINASIQQADRLIEEAETGFPPETVFMVVHDYFRSLSDRRLHMTAFVHLKSANALALEIFSQLYLPQGLRRHPDLSEVTMEDLGTLPTGHLVWAVDYEGDGCLSLVWSEADFCARVYVYRQRVERTYTAGMVELGGPQSSKMELD